MYQVTKDVIIPVAAIVFSIIVAYFTAVYAIRRESRQGRLRLLELVRRYFISLLNTLDRDSGRVKQNALTKQMYVEELKAILIELEATAANPYFSILIVRYPLISKLLVQVRREIVEHSAQQAFAVNVGTINDLWRLHQILRTDMPKIVNADIDTTIVGLAATLKLQGIEVRS